MSAADPESVLLPGPWEHRFVAANGARFHLAEQGEGPLVLLLHGFPQFWWTWRHQLDALAEAGFRAAAMDLRGYGASDKPPVGYDLRTVAADVSGVIQSLGEEHAVVVGHALGGAVAWTAAHLHPERVWALGVVSAPHPNLIRSMQGRSMRTALAGLRRVRVTESDLTKDPEGVTGLLRSGGGDPGWVTAEVAQRYTEAMTIPFAAHCATELNRWMLRSQVSADGRRLRRDLVDPVDAPLLLAWGAADPVLTPSAMRASLQWAPRRASSMVLDGLGHFPQEEAPELVSRALVRWLDSLA